MAATDRIQMFMTLTGDRFWTNVFYVNALTLNDASIAASVLIGPALADQMDGSFKVVKALTSHLADNSFMSVPLNIAGALSGSAYLPLFNTTKVLISVAGSGRNDYKFLRGGVTEARQINGQLESTVITAVESTWNTLIADMTASGVDMVDNQGNAWQIATCQQAVQMRQLHRKRKKVVVP
jgi:hypothetical protein